MKNKKKILEKPADTEQEIRRDRKFSLAEAVGREAAGALKGASPVTAARQLLLEIENILATKLDDPEGSLQRTIMARLANDPPLLARHFGNAPAALCEFLDGILVSTLALTTLVRDADARWGRDFTEKPYFNSPDQTSHPEDPYTPQSVGARLQVLQSRIC